MEDFSYKIGKAQKMRHQNHYMQYKIVESEKLI